MHNAVPLTAVDIGGGRSLAPKANARSAQVIVTSQKIVLLLVTLGLASCDKMVDPRSNDTNRRAAAAAVTQYEINTEGASAADRCLQAGLAAAAYLQAQDESNYAKWRALEEASCAETKTAR